MVKNIFNFIKKHWMKFAGGIIILILIIFFILGFKKVVAFLFSLFFLSFVIENRLKEKKKSDELYKKKIDSIDNIIKEKTDEIKNLNDDDLLADFNKILRKRRASKKDHL